ncbi:TIGR03620 family F420-dependent LLM class oxidoreductase [Pseudonocardia lacus]|uniref:TIGR03620 family F420-dependent LLM class oxidoreductase n=1 Tax=Pseudonocardia lacus TaxID=2835865 RepID=UPI001BDC3ECC|nr:TIGR03620 family F420-dependent LLM class oxidoreductase [Pseudonocardia lacus]
MWDYHLNYHDSGQVREWVAELERLGLSSIWIGEARFRDPLTFAGILLAATTRLTVATGVANIWVRDPFAMVAAQATLAEAYPDRFLLGLGVSHSLLVESRGHRYAKPLSVLRAYLDAMDGAWDAYQAVKPSPRPPHVLAALGPRMLDLAAERAAGAHTYLVPVVHTERARRRMGSASLLVPEQAVVLDSNVERARALARTHIRRYLPLANYVNNLRRLGFDDRDFEGHGSDRLVDQLVVHGTAEEVLKRVDEHRQAGATSVCLNVISPWKKTFPLPHWRVLLGSDPPA